MTLDSVQAQIGSEQVLKLSELSRVVEEFDFERGLADPWSTAQ